MIFWESKVLIHLCVHVCMYGWVGKERKRRVVGKQENNREVKKRGEKKNRGEKRIPSSLSDFMH